MEFIALTILVLASLFGFIALFFTTFGTLVILIGSLIYAVLTNLAVLTIQDLFVLFILYLCGEVLEYALIIIGAKKLGASNAAVLGAFVGGILGATLGVAFLGLGLIAGAFLGIFLGAFLVELTIHKDLIKSLKAGAGSVLGRIGSIIAKVFIAIIMFIIIFSRVFNLVSF